MIKKDRTEIAEVQRLKRFRMAIKSQGFAQGMGSDFAMKEFSFAVGIQKIIMLLIAGRRVR